MAMALIWGLVLAGPRMSGRRWLSAPVMTYIEVMRNTPLLLQIYLVYFGLPLIGLGLSPFASGAVAIAAQHGAFLAEVYRGGIESVSVRQWEAARALGMDRWRALRLVVLPQALLKVVPPVGNHLVILVKDSSLVSAIGIMDLTLTGKAIIERSGASYEVFVTIALFYLALTSLLSAVLRFVERRYRGTL
jgi:polar amino acid transport system permease protein